MSRFISLSSTSRILGMALALRRGGLDLGARSHLLADSGSSSSPPVRRLAQHRLDEAVEAPAILVGDRPSRSPRPPGWPAMRECRAGFIRNVEAVHLRHHQVEHDHGRASVRQSAASAVAPFAASATSQPSPRAAAGASISRIAGSSSTTSTEAQNVACVCRRSAAASRTGSIGLGQVVRRAERIAHPSIVGHRDHHDRDVRQVGFDS